MAAEALSVRGLTGVELTLPIAGPGTRSYAFLIDWQIRLLVALAWLLIAVLLRLLPGISGRPAAHTLLVAGSMFALVSYFFYHPVLEVAMRGRTPGLRKAGARIVTLEGATPGTGALLIRNVFRLIDCLPVFYAVGLTCCLLTDKRVRLGDMVAGTVLVLDGSEATRALERLGAQMLRTRLSLDALQLVHDLLDRWGALEEAQRRGLAQALLAKLDPQSDPRRDAQLADAPLRARLESLLAHRPRY